jgi:hypothetical protein
VCIEKYFGLGVVRAFLRVTTHACLQAIWIFGKFLQAIEDAFNGALLLWPRIQPHGVFECPRLLLF